VSDRAGTQGSRTRDGVADNCSWDRIVTSTPDLPPAKDDPDEDEAQLTAFPWAEPPFKVDYCGRISIGENSFFNFNFIVLNTCEVRIGSRCLFGPNVSLFVHCRVLSFGYGAS
jgi:acetyltransferase-like isoleucine patch superfamily enzyme